MQPNARTPKERGHWISFFKVGDTCIDRNTNECYNTTILQSVPVAFWVLLSSRCMDRLLVPLSKHQGGRSFRQIEIHNILVLDQSTPQNPGRSLKATVQNVLGWSDGQTFQARATDPDGQAKVPATSFGRPRLRRRPVGHLQDYDVGHLQNLGKKSHNSEGTELPAVDR